MAGPATDVTTGAPQTFKEGNGGGASAQPIVFQTEVGSVTFDAGSDTITPPPGWTVLDQRNDVAGPATVAMSITDGTRTLYVAYFDLYTVYSGVASMSPTESFDDFVASLDHFNQDRGARR